MYTKNASMLYYAELYERKLVRGDQIAESLSQKLDESIQ